MALARTADIRRSRERGRLCRSASPYTGWVSRATVRRPSCVHVHEPLGFGVLHAGGVGDLFQDRTCRAARRPRAVRSRRPCPAPGPASLAATSSTSRPGAVSGRCSDQMPPVSRRAPESTAPISSSRRYSALPRLTSQSRRTLPLATGPPSTATSTASVSASLHDPRSIRSARPSFHSAVTGSGAGPGVRRLASTLQAPFWTSWWTRAAEPSSRNWASSTTSSSRRSGPARSRMASLACRSSPSRSPGRMPGLGEKRRERAERYGSRCPGGDRLGGREPQPGGRPGRLGGQPGLADAGCSGQHERSGFRSVQPREDPVHLGIAGHERDLAQSALFLTASSFASWTVPRHKVTYPGARYRYRPGRPGQVPGLRKRSKVTRRSRSHPSWDYPVVRSGPRRPARAVVSDN